MPRGFSTHLGEERDQQPAQEGRTARGLRRWDELSIVRSTKQGGESEPHSHGKNARRSRWDTSQILVMF